MHMVFSCWLALLVVLIGQCIAYDVLVHQAPARLAADLLWYVQNWGLWLVVTPFLYDVYYKRARAGTISLKDFVPAALLCCGLLLALEFLVQSLLDPTLNIVTYTLYFLPRYSLAILVLTLAWLWRNKTLVANCWQTQRQSMAPTLTLVPPVKVELADSIPNCQTQNPPAGLVAFKGRDKAFVYLADIEGVVAARNYLDIYCSHGEYIVRDTMKNMEALLTGQNFVRTHRSALVRLSAVRRFKRLASGNGVAILMSNTEIPVNKNFMSALGKGDIFMGKAAIATLDRQVG